MKISRRVLYISFAIILAVGILAFSFYGNHEVKLSGEPVKAEKVNLNGFENLYKLSDSVYRSEQPDQDGMKALEKIGVRTVLNLRNYHTDDDEAKGTSLVLEWVPMNAGEITEKQILKAMQVIVTSKKPVLIHCLHGSDRTGCMVASYRIIFQNWTKEDAIKELQNPVFGYHASWFPNIVEMLNSMDVEKMRKELYYPSLSQVREAR